MAIDFSVVTTYASDELPLRTYRARDGEMLAYALAEVPGADTCLVFCHGSSARHEYLAGFARHVSTALGIAVCTPTFRGHGDNPRRRGDIDYIDQLEDDAIDLLRQLRDAGYARFFVGGHSSGGGFAVRLAASPRFAREGLSIEGIVLGAPMLGYKAVSSRKDSGGWAVPQLGVMVGALLLNALGVHALDARVALRFVLPERLRAVSTTEYSYRMYAGMHPRSVSGGDIRRIAVPLLIVVGSDDEIFIADKYAELLRQYKQDGEVVIVPGVRHISMMADQKVQEVIIEWLRKTRFE